MSDIIIASIVLGVFIFLSALYIRGGLITLAISLSRSLKDIENNNHGNTTTIVNVLYDLIHEGIGIDEDLTQGERAVRGGIAE